MIYLNIIIGDVSHSQRYCKTGPTHDRANASIGHLSPNKDKFNIEEDTWTSYQILS